MHAHGLSVASFQLDSGTGHRFQVHLISKRMWQAGVRPDGASLNSPNPLRPTTQAGKSQAARARGAFLEAALHQEVGWFDAGGAEGVLESLNEEAGRLQQALGERLPSAVRNLTMLIVGLGIGE